MDYTAAALVISGSGGERESPRSAGSPRLAEQAPSVFIASTALKLENLMGENRHLGASLHLKLITAHRAAGPV